MHKSRLLAGLGVGAAMILVTAGTGGALGARVPDPIPVPIPTGDITIGLETVASGLVNPVTATFAPGDKDHLYVAEQAGKIWQIAIDGEHGPAAPRLVADLSSVVIPLGCFGINYDERGLFGLAFSPDFKHDGLLYTYSSQTPEGQAPLPPNRCNSRQPRDHDNVVTEWKMSKGRSSRAVVDPASAREVLRNPQPQFNHNGGEIRFGPDGKLYVAIGDGGNADDEGQGHGATGNAQDLSSLNGKILRIDPNAGSHDPGHSVPADNPFVGTPGARGEIFALGFRNPYKMSFDAKRATLYVADVGQNDVEEVDIVTGGANYGWPVKEGSFAFNNNGPLLPGFVTGDAVTGPYTDPVAEYDHCVGPVDPTISGACPVAEGIAVVGGFRYRGHDVEALRGRYVFGDYSRSFFTSDGRLLSFGADHAVSQLRIAGRASLGLGLLGIGEDGRGELYVLGKSGAKPGNTGITDVTNTTGVVLRVVAADDQRGDGEHDDGDEGGNDR